MIEKERRIIVPALTGKFGNWRYYQLILKVKELVSNFGSEEKPDYRVKAVEEVEEIYSKSSVSKWLQRAFDPRRLDPIKNYILKQPDKYLNNLTLAIFGGSPKWFSMNLFGKVDFKSKDNFQDIEKKIGFIELKGTETLFVLDGQHRLKGLRKAYQENPSKIQDEEIVCTLIIHIATSEGRIRTRRLFSTVNRQAKPVSTGENILLDEDDASAIIVRELIENYKHFKSKEIIALAKSGNITKGDYSKFSTVMTLSDINDTLIEHDKIYPKIGKTILKIRPLDKDIKTQTKRVFDYWDKFFLLFPSALKFINDTEENRVKYREDGGNFILRPIAQIAIIEVIIACEEESVNLRKFKKLPLDLNDKFWHYILWDPYKNNMLFNRGLVRNYIKYNLKLNLKPSELSSLKELYKKNSGEHKLSLKKSLF